MVKLTGPSLAAGATGALAGDLVFSTSKGRQYLKKLTKPKQPRTAGQIAMRAIMTYISARWAIIPTADRATWNAIAEAAGISPFNAYQQENLKRWRSELYPTDAYPAAETEAPPTVNQFWMFGQVRAITFQVQSNQPRNGAWSIHLGTSAAPGTHWHNLIHFIRILDNTLHEWLHTPVTPGVYYASTNSCSSDGRTSVTVHRGPVTVTN